ERIRVDGTPITRAAVVEGIVRIETATASLLADGTIDREPTFFEVTTALAFDAFRNANVDDAVVEVGIGGRLDSTNVIDAAVGVITTIELEHTDVLGPTVADIAHEKAGILHRGMRAIVGALPPSARAVVDRESDTLGVPIAHLGEEIRTGERTLFEGGQRFSIGTPLRTERSVELPLFGRFQVDNAALAVAAVEEYARLRAFPLTDREIEKGLAEVRWRGRLERIGRRPEAYLDVAHTPESARAVAESLAEILPFADPSESAVVLGCLSDKRAGPILEALSPLARTLVVVPVRSMRSADPSELRRAAIGRFPRIVQAPAAAEGFALARAAVGTDGLLLVTGSDYLVGEILEHLEGRPAGEPDLSDPGLSVGAGSSATFATSRAGT
ncbi:MAG: hypothetical protein L3J93_06140, partial [Thermoplasmata archaeon]|nr:hypothetical protein [Thermoplasmata archaeon]